MSTETHLHVLGWCMGLGACTCAQRVEADVREHEELLEQTGLRVEEVEVLRDQLQSLGVLNEMLTDEKEVLQVCVCAACPACQPAYPSACRFISLSLYISVSLSVYPSGFGGCQRRCEGPVLHTNSNSRAARERSALCS